MRKVFSFIVDHAEYIFIAILIGIALFLGLSQGGFAESNLTPDNPNHYANKIFDQSYVHKVEVEIDEEKYNELLSAPTDKSKYLANVIIDGERINDIAFSTRGNASLFTLAEDESTDRYSYKINFQKFHDAQRYHGLDKLILNNLYADSSYLRDYLAFEIMRESGVSAPLTSFTELYINGELRGLYLAIEDVDKSFLARNAFPSESVLYKPEATALDKYALKKIYESIPEGEELQIVLSADDPEFNCEGSDLVYIGDDIISYPAVFNNAVSKVSSADKEYFIKSIKSLSPVSLDDPTEYWDIDALVQYFATNNFLVGWDSYTGSTAHNYYLLVAPGKNTLLPWDYNLALMSTRFIDDFWVDEDWPIDELMVRKESDTRPVWKLIIDNPDNYEKYHEALQRLLDSYILNGKYRETINRITDLIRPYVYSDPTRFHSVEEFETDINNIRSFILLRADSVQKQLWGIERSTFEPEPEPEPEDELEEPSYEEYTESELYELWY